MVYFEAVVAWKQYFSNESRWAIIVRRIKLIEWVDVLKPFLYNRSYEKRAFI